jgi:peroxiredoxin
MAVNSQMIPLGSPAPDFKLPDPQGTQVSLHDFDDAPALLVVFLSKHCPYVQHVKQGIASLANDLMPRGLAVVGVFANDWTTHPDAPSEIPGEGYPFPVLVDETQDVAKAFHAACTPDFFLFDGDRRLVYRGQMDDSRPGNDEPVTGADLRAAVDAVLAGSETPVEQRPSVGCSIKWRAGNEPNYAP